MRKSLCVAIGLLVTSVPATAEIFKCPRENGAVIYQNFPCEIDSIGSSATAAPPQEAPTAPRSAPAAPAKAATPPVKAAAAPQRVADDGDEPAGPRVTRPKPAPKVGMSPGQVRRVSWGEPENITYTETDDGKLMIWTYADNHTIHFDINGRVAKAE